MCAFSSKFPIGKIVHTLAMILACATATDASINYSRYVPQRPANSHRPHGKIADALAPTHACTTANALVIYRMYVLQRPCKLPIARWDFHMFRACACLCLQGGGVHISSGTVTFSSCTITGNTAGYVRAHAQKFPSPRWDSHMFCACACRGAVCTSRVAAQ